jgi:dienelactone hydrolase
VTAVLAGLAGAMLIGLAVAVLWRTRRLDEHPARRYGRRLATGVACLFAVYLVILPTSIAIVATHKARSPVAAVDIGAPYERVTLKTYDGLKLAAWYVPSRNGAAVIAFPGRSQPVPHARMLVRHGYGVLLLDRRGEGESEGDYNAFGWGGEADVAAAVGFLRGRPDVDPDRIGGLGLSVGGELLLQAAAHTRTLRAVVSEGAGVRSLAEHLHTPGVGRVQRWFSNWVVQTGALAVLSDDSPPQDLTELVASIAPRALMLIGAERGAGGEELNGVYFEAAGEPKHIWRAKGGHTRGLAIEPAEYERRVVSFFDRALR